MMRAQQLYISPCLCVCVCGCGCVCGCVCVSWWVYECVRVQLSKCEVMELRSWNCNSNKTNLYLFLGSSRHGITHAGQIFSRVVKQVDLL